MTPEQIVDLVSRTVARWPQLEASSMTYAVWAEDLDGVTFEDAHRALKDYARQGNAFPPTAGQLYTAVKAGELGLPSVEQAMAEALRLAGTVGHARRPEFSHEIIRSTIAACGGWRDFCLSEMPAARDKQFREMFQAAAARMQREAVTAPADRPALPSGPGKTLGAG